jgi:hypothetical protein
MMPDRPEHFICLAGNKTVYFMFLMMRCKAYALSLIGDVLGFDGME